MDAEEITEFYKLTYVPDGYNVVKDYRSIFANYVKWENSEGQFFTFEQVPKNTVFHLDSERGETQIISIAEYDVYYRILDGHYYIWCDEKYSVEINSSTHFSDEELTNIINGITIE